MSPDPIPSSLPPLGDAELERVLRLACHSLLAWVRTLLMGNYRLPRHARRQLSQSFREMIIFTCCPVLVLWVAALWGFMHEEVRFYMVVGVGATMGLIVWLVYRLARFLEKH